MNQPQQPIDYPKETDSGVERDGAAPAWLAAGLIAAWGALIGIIAYLNH